MIIIIINKYFVRWNYLLVILSYSNLTILHIDIVAHCFCILQHIMCGQFGESESFGR